MSKDYGYIRVSYKDQNEKRQLQELLKLGIARENIFIEKASGKDFKRDEYKKLLKILKPNDALYIQSVNRLGRNYDEILEQWSKITKRKKVNIKVIDLPILNTDNRANTLTEKFTRDITLLGQAFNAEQEWHNIKNSQAQGIAIAKKEGKRFGRAKTEYPANFLETYVKWKNKEIKTATAMEVLELSARVFYRMVKEYVE
ncbi:MAG: recombinase family protein [Oscillospiraceae bacterium]|nr:recombinase family protein [Oscillospiraceae bacterium]